MTGSQRDARACRHRASAVVWNVVVPALGLALILGAPILGALAIAAVASVALRALLAPRSPSDRPRGASLGHVAARRTARGS